MQKYIIFKLIMRNGCTIREERQIILAIIVNVSLKSKLNNKNNMTVSFYICSMQALLLRCHQAQNVPEI